jgi:tRNA (guanine-N7-)-methyltransferase
MRVQSKGVRTASPDRQEQPERPPVSRVQTFHGRRGRLRTRRRDALARLLPVYGVTVTGDVLNPRDLFGRDAPLVLEIGPGMGNATAVMAATDPDRDYLAAEVHAPGVANLLQLIEEQKLANLRVAHGDALELLEQRLAPGSLAAVHAFFPDPWPKARHHKRRLFQPAHVSLLRSRLAPGGTLHAVTDWPDYAHVIRDVLDAEPELHNPYRERTPGGWAPRQPQRPKTKYERRALAEGRLVHELLFRRRDAGLA